MFDVETHERWYAFTGADNVRYFVLEDDLQNELSQFLLIMATTNEE